MSDDTPSDADGHDEPRERTRDEIGATVRRAAERKGGLEAYCSELLDDNLDYRRQIRELKKELAGLRKPDAVQLSKKDADELAAWRALGVTADDATKQLAERAGLVAQVKGFEQDAVVRQAAALEAYGFAPEVLADLLRTRGLVLALAEVEVKGEDGKTTKRPGATVRAADQAEADAVELGAYVEQHLAAYKPALVPAAAPKPVPSDGPGGSPASAWPRQHGKAPPPTSKVSDEDLESRARATGDYAPL